MHQVDHYELVIARDPDQADAEVLLLTLETSDLPEAFLAQLGQGGSGSARWCAFETGRGIELTFNTGEATQQLQMAPLSAGLAEKLAAFKRVLVVLMEDGRIRNELDLALAD